MPRHATVAETNLDRITTHLTVALPLLNELHDAFGPPFILSIVNTIQALINSVQNVKQNKRECARLMDGMHEVLYAIVKLHMESEIPGSLPLSIVNNIGKFIETLHKIYTFVEAQKQGNRIKHFFRNNEIKKLLQECHIGLKQAQEVFQIQTQTQTLNVIKDFKQTANLLHKDLIEFIEKLSDTSTVSEKSSVYLGVNESKNSSNSFSMLPSKPKIFHGREHELEHIIKLISQLPPRIAIMGGGGMGKTSLARAVLHHPDITSKFEHRFFVSAETATNSVELAALIGLQVGLNPSEDLTQPVVQYFSRKESCLLILDNLETAWEPIQSRAGIEEFLAQLTGLGDVGLMITMRGAERPAKVQWTHPFLLPLQPLSKDAARQTFIEITDNCNTIEEMDHLLGFTDNMPLAVDLIAHLAEYEGFSSVLSRWETEKTSLLSVGFDRQSSLDVSISLSLSSPRVAPDSKELLSLLSILPNGLSEVDLVHGNLGIPNILSCKAALQATSLAYQDTNHHLVLLRPIREYIQRTLPASLSQIHLISRHFYHILEIFRKYRGEQMKVVGNQITLNLANLQEVIQLGLHLHAPMLADTIRCALSLNRFYSFTGRNHFPLLDNIQCILPQLHDPQLETRILAELLYTSHYRSSVSEEMIVQAIIHLDDLEDPVLGCKFYSGAAGYFQYIKGDAQQAVQCLQKALEMSELSEDRHPKCSILVQLGWLKFYNGDYHAGKLYATAAQRLCKLSANLYEEAAAIYLEATCSGSLGDYQQGAAQLHRAPELLHVCGMSGGVLNHEITRYQAQIHFLKSEYQEARNIVGQIIETTSAEENAFSYSGALVISGLIDTLVGNTSEDFFHKLKTVQEISKKFGGHEIIICQIMQAIMELKEKRFDSAKLKFEEALYLLWSIDFEYTVFCVEQLADIEAWPISVSQHKWPIIYLVLAHKSRGKLDLHKALLFLGDVFSAIKDESTATTPPFVTKVLSTLPSTVLATSWRSGQQTWKYL
ncbi:hypothetical protein K438DRAFT_1783056 [Mycena galopus ATCC 62051]|nr:hypothetical protein K438DRAFT_1783056 [Mycena galopus ATCC 62051]